MRENALQGEHLIFNQSCRSVKDAARAALNTVPENIIKNICLVDKSGNLIVAIVKGEDRVSTSRVGKGLMY